jgi:tol-pal system protein YbgF
MLSIKMSKRLIFITLTLFIICDNIKSDNHNYLKKVIERLNSVEKELRNIQGANPSVTSAENTSINYIDSIANHEQRLVDIEEELRDLNGFLEEINHKIDNLINTSKQTDNQKEKADSYSEQSKSINNNTVLFEDKNPTILKDPNIEKNPTMKILGTVGENKNIESKQISKDIKSKENLTANLPEVTEEKKTLLNDQLTELSKSPSEIYKYAYDMLIRENYIEAENSFTTFIGEHPNDPLASNAYYWLGETYYVQKNYQLAAVSFAKGFQRFPRGNKALDQLFKLALTFISLGKNEDACATFSKLEAEFPDAPKIISNRAKVHIQRAKC